MSTVDLPHTGSGGPTSTSSPGDRSTEFVPVEGGAETTSAGALLVAAYAVMWCIVFAFIFGGWRRQARLEERIDGLERSLAKRESPAGD